MNVTFLVAAQEWFKNTSDSITTNNYAVKIVLKYFYWTSD